MACAWRNSVDVLCCARFAVLGNDLVDAQKRLDKARLSQVVITLFIAFKQLSKTVAFVTI